MRLIREATTTSKVDYLGLTPEDGQTRVSDTGSVEGGPKDAGSNTTLYTGVQSRGGEVGPLLTG
jgi:hypothetical protein